MRTSGQLWQLRSSLERVRHPEKGHALGEVVVVDLAAQGQPSCGSQSAWVRAGLEDLVAGFEDLKRNETREAAEALEELDELEQEEVVYRVPSPGTPAGRGAKTKTKQNF